MAQIGRSKKNNENDSRNEKYHSSSINIHQQRVPKEPVMNISIDLLVPVTMKQLHHQQRNENKSIALVVTNKNNNNENKVQSSLLLRTKKEE